MAETVIPGPVSECAPIREATCIHTKKIYDSCQSKDCIEDLRVYPTASSQTVLDSAQSVRCGRAELLYVSIQVEPVGYHRGFYTVDLRFFYRICAEAFTAGSCVRPTPVTGLAVFDKRCMLFGSQGTAKIFNSERPCALDQSLSFEDNLPSAIVEAVDPLLLHLKLVDRCACCGCGCGPSGEGLAAEVPSAILSAFDESIVFSNSGARCLLVTLGQFSILRMERDSQLLIPVYDYCMPNKECDCGSSSCGCQPEDPCQLFEKVCFPVGEFFPPASSDCLDPMEQLRQSCAGGGGTCGGGAGYGGCACGR